ncbi:MAG: aminotransferase class V-fold PLP-dependent enzyme [Rhodanobacteraceae bacterium]
MTSIGFHPSHSSRLTDIDWIVNHLGEERERYFGAVVPPIVQSSIFAFPDVAAFRKGFCDELKQHVYTRGNNPTVEILRKKIAALEGADDCLIFASGAAAISAGVIANVRAGEHVVCVARPYSWTRSLLRELMPAFAVGTTFVDARETANIEAALTETTRLIVLESPNSMTFEQQDLAAVAALARARNLRTLCDNSWASPLHQSPLSFGIDLVAHSATKYLNGHSDVVGGVLCGSEELIRKVFGGPFMTLGAIMSPNDAWLMLRGLRTLPLRMQRIAATTPRVIAFLQEHPKVRRVHAPHARAYPQAELSERQLHGVSGLFSIELDAPDVAAVERFCNGLERFLMTVSWGGYESLAFPVCAVFPIDAPLVPSAGGVPLTLVRLSIGLEAPEILIADLAQALARI